MLGGMVGIFLNIFLFGIKFAAGLISNSIAITADAFNNLSDAGSSVITLLGFKMAAAKPDPEHPFGHGRMEYLAGLTVSGIIILMGFELLTESAGKILHPEDTSFSFLVIAILLISILVKMYMAFYNTSLSKKIESSAMKATATDSLSDCLATTMVLVSMFIGKYTSLHVDGFFGVIVAAIIIYAGICAARDTLNPLLGQPPEKEFVDRIEELVMSQEGIVGLHDLLVHDYGPGRVMISLHAEVPANVDIMISHDIIDNTEHLLEKELSCKALIHMDPVVVDDPGVTRLKKQVVTLIRNWNPDATMHDFRVIFGSTHNNLVFDVVVPFDVDLSEKEIQQQIANLVKQQIGPTYYAAVTVDRSYV
jgi:cation diffusion facilitator family transporter